MAPRPGLTTAAKVTRVIDADTIEVTVTRKFPVRLVHGDGPRIFNCPEKNTPEGVQAKKFVENLLRDKEVTLFVSAQNSDILTDINSFNRILGEIWVDNQRLTDILLEKGFGEIIRREDRVK